MEKIRSIKNKLMNLTKRNKIKYNFCGMSMEPYPTKKSNELTIEEMSHYADYVIIHIGKKPPLTRYFYYPPVFINAYAISKADINLFVSYVENGLNEFTNDPDILEKYLAQTQITTKNNIGLTTLGNYAYIINKCQDTKKKCELMNMYGKLLPIVDDPRYKLKVLEINNIVDQIPRYEKLIGYFTYWIDF